MTKKTKNVKNNVEILALAIVSSLIGLILWAILLGNEQFAEPSKSATEESTEAPSQTHVEPWLGLTKKQAKLLKSGKKDKLPKAKVYIYDTSASGNVAWKYGKVEGMLLNNTTSAFSYVQVTFGIYTESGAKLDTCMANTINLKPGGSWQFEAPCINWSSGGSYSLESVVYW